MDNIKKFLSKIMNGFFSICNAILMFTTKYPMLLIAFVVVLVGSILVLMVNKNTNVGGILGKLWGMLSGKKTLDNVQQANTIPADRQQAIGEADANGFTQHNVQELVISANPFRDKTVVNLSDGTNIKLPQGVKDTDVSVLIQANSTIVVVPTPEMHQQLLQTQTLIKSAQDTNTSAQQLIDRLKANQ